MLCPLNAPLEWITRTTNGRPSSVVRRCAGPEPPRWPCASLSPWNRWNGRLRRAVSRWLAWPEVRRPGSFPTTPGCPHREYGHRVGIFRLLDVLEKHGVKATIAMDALTAEHYPYLVRHCLDRGCEIIGHGISVSRMITGNMSESEEREYIQTSLDMLNQATGTAPQGWFGPGIRRVRPHSATVGRGRG